MSSAKPPFIAYASLLLLGLLTATAAETFRDYAIEWNQRELVRATSPDRRVDAILVEPIVKSIGGGEALYLVPIGDPAPASEPVLRGSRLTGPPKLHWSKSQLLEVQYDRGCVAAFSNVWHSGEVEEGRYYVEVRLDPTANFACIVSPAATGAN